MVIKAFEKVQLFPDEYKFLKELLSETEKDWELKHQKLLESIKLQKGQINHKLERLADCYLEGGFDKETYQDKKDKLLIEIKTKEIAEKELLQNIDGVLMKIEKFFELAKSLTKSYETGFFDEKVELLKIVASNILIDGKKLAITMQSPFYELAKRHDFDFCPPTRDAFRKIGSSFIYCEVNTSPIIGKPLSRDALKSLLEEIIANATNLPDISSEVNHVIQANNTNA